MSVHRSYHWDDGRRWQELRNLERVGCARCCRFTWNSHERIPMVPLFPRNWRVFSISYFTDSLNTDIVFPFNGKRLPLSILRNWNFLLFQRCCVSLRFCENRKEIYFKTSISFLTFNVKYCSLLFRYSTYRQLVPDFLPLFTICR